ncbi:MAG TPA: hypothetical protein PLR99_21975 [Polyangiaceae bacterium]|nr:hypothetical protein [Polyangiaceae bacterium]
MDIRDPDIAELAREQHVLRVDSSERPRGVERPVRGEARHARAVLADLDALGDEGELRCGVVYSSLRRRIA